MTFAQYQARIGAGGDVASLQKQYLLPVIMEEKEAFIRAEYGRLQSVMGSEYHEGETTHVFHPLPEAEQGEERPLGNPQELELAELAIATIGGLALSLLSGFVEEKKTDAKIEEKVRKALAEAKKN